MSSFKTMAFATFNVDKIAEERILEAMNKGEFDNLEGKGKKLEFDDDSMVPEDLRMAYKLLKNANCLPPDLLHDQEINNSYELLADMDDEQERYKQMQKLNVLITKQNLKRKKPVNLEHDQVYLDKVVSKVKVYKK